MYNFGTRLKDERKRLDVTQDVMAKMGGIAKTTYCNYEAGLREPGAAFLATLAAAGVDARYIITGVREETALQPGDPGQSSTLDIQMVLEVMIGVEIFLEREGYQLKPEKKALLVRLLSEEIAEKERAEGRKIDRSNAVFDNPFNDLIRLAI